MSATVVTLFHQNGEKWERRDQATGGAVPLQDCFEATHPAGEARNGLRAFRVLKRISGVSARTAITDVLRPIQVVIALSRKLLQTALRASDAITQQQC